MKYKFKIVYKVKCLVPKSDEQFRICFIQDFNLYPFYSETRYFQFKSNAERFLKIHVVLFKKQFPEYVHKLSKQYFSLTPELRKVKV